MPGKPGYGFYFEKFRQHIRRNLGSNKKVCVLAVIEKCVSKAVMSGEGLSDRLLQGSSSRVESNHRQRNRALAKKNQALQFQQGARAHVVKYVRGKRN